MRIITAILLITSAVFLNSCAFQTGAMSGNAAITNDDFQVVGLAKGTAKSVRIFGIGGLKKEALVLEAKENLYYNFPLKRGQALNNVTVDISNKFALVYHETVITVSAEVVDFNTGSDQKFFNRKSFEIKVGDTVKAVMNQKIHWAMVTSNDGIIAKVEYVLNDENMSRSIATEELKSWNIPKTIGGRNFNIADKIRFEKGGRLFVGQIIAYSKNEIILRYLGYGDLHYTVALNNQDFLESLRE
jgi:hypothetical protein